MAVAALFTASALSGASVTAQCAVEIETVDARDDRIGPRACVARVVVERAFDEREFHLGIAAREADREREIVLQRRPRGREFERAAIGPDRIRVTSRHLHRVAAVECRCGRIRAQVPMRGCQSGGACGFTAIDQRLRGGGDGVVVDIGRGGIGRRGEHRVVGVVERGRVVGRDLHVGAPEGRPPVEAAAGGGFVVGRRRLVCGVQAAWRRLDIHCMDPHPATE
jgi:hypothetical protein